MSFEAKLSSSALLKDAVSIAYEIVKDEAAFRISNDGLFMNAMDPANVSMIILRILRPAFETYKIDSETTIGIDMDKLFQVLKQADASDSVTLKLDDESSSTSGKKGAGNTLKIIFKGRTRRTFSVPLMDVPMEGRPVPALNFEAKVVMNSAALAQGVSDAEIISDAVALTIPQDAKEFVMEAKGSLGHFELRASKEDENTPVKEIDANKPCRAVYAVDYLKKMIKASKINEDVIIQFRTDFPLRLDYVKTDVMQLSFILAPRVETD